MEKIILRKFIKITIIVSVFIFSISLISVIFAQNNSVKKDVVDMISEVEVSYNKNEISIEETKEFFLDDYLNRAYAIDYMLENNPEENLKKEALKKIKDLMEINQIHIIDTNGVISFSTDDKLIGINLLDHKDAHYFWNLIKSDDIKENVIEMNVKGIVDKKDKIYIAIKSKLKDFSIIQIEIDRDIYEKLIEKNSIEYTVNNTPTVYQKAVFVVSRENGELKSITRNNDQDLNFDNIKNNDELVEKLYGLTNGRFEKINGRYRYIKTRIIDDYIIGAYVDADLVYKSVLIDMTFLSLGIVTIFLLLVIILKYSIRKYILKDIINIEKNIHELIDGNYDIEFKTTYNTELKEITYILNEWKESYRYKSERMSRILYAINTHSSVFECLYVINKNFFSDNMKEILGVSDETWNIISKEPLKFENYINSLEAKDDVVYINNKFLKIVSFKKENEFYGMIMDKTNDEETKNIIKKQSETDVLTNLLNRKGLEDRIKPIFKEDKEGILIIFDLDNFKRVNDELGHPVGDEVLKSFARCLQRHFIEKQSIETSIISRMGGDEFVVYIDENIEKDKIVKILDRLLNCIRDELGEYYKKYKLSTSIGVAYRSNTVNTYDDLYKEADNALYKAKNLGKDKFFII